MPPKTGDSATTSSVTKWKRWFFGCLALWVLTLGVLGFTIVSSIETGVIKFYQSKRLEDCELHRDLLSEAAKGKLDRSDFANVHAFRVSGSESTLVDSRAMLIQFDVSGKYVLSNVGSSSAPWKERTLTP